jgi:hypothetical protein
MHDDVGGRLLVDVGCVRWGGLDTWRYVRELQRYGDVGAIG